MDPGGLDLTTSFEVDLRGNVSALADPRGVRHDENGNVTEVRRGVGEGAGMARTQYDYGLLNEVPEVRREVTPGAGDWSTEQRSYDENLNLTEVVAPEGQTTRLEYDPRNFTRIVYDDNGNPTVVRFFDAEGRLLALERTRYDALDRPRRLERSLWSSTVEAGAINPPEGAREVVSATTYDAAGNVTAVTDPRGVTTRLEYDAAERLKAIEDSLGNRTELDLDPGGNVLATTDLELLPEGGAATVRTSGIYDALGRRTSRFLYARVRSWGSGSARGVRSWVGGSRSDS